MNWNKPQIKITNKWKANKKMFVRSRADQSTDFKIEIINFTVPTFLFLFVFFLVRSLTNEMIMVIFCDCMSIVPTFVSFYSFLSIHFSILHHKHHPFTCTWFDNHNVYSLLKCIDATLFQRAGASIISWHRKINF